MSLADYLLDGSDEPLADTLAGWLAASPRFRAFAEAHRDKIRKKLRSATDPDARLDVRAELLVARLLLDDRRIELAFEARGAARGGPDFSVTFRTHHAFELEVTRPRHASDLSGLGRTVLAKLRQLPTGTAAVLLLAVPGDDAVAIDLASLARELRARADARDDAFLQRGGFASPRDFYARFLRLGAIVAWSEAAFGDARARAWVNSSARIPVPDRALQACLGSLRVR